MVNLLRFRRRQLSVMCGFKRFIVFAVVSLCLVMLIVSPRFTARAGRVKQMNLATNGPTLLTVGTSTRGVALESVTQCSEPFPPNATIRFGSDGRTRVMLFATNLALLPGENASAVTAEAEDGNLVRYPLTVDYVGAVPGYDWLSSVVVRLNDSLGDAGDVLVSINLHGTASNRVRIGIGHVGGGPPDDPPPAPSPTPDLGPGASLH